MTGAMPATGQKPQSGSEAATSHQAPPAQSTDQQLRDAARQLREAFQQKGNRDLIQNINNINKDLADLVQGRQTVTGVPPRFGRDDRIPPEAVQISIVFFLTVAAIIIFLPLARAFARRMDRRSGASQIPGEVATQLEHLNQAVDAIALEVERISEGQRFATRLLTEQRAVAPNLTTGANR